MIRIFRFLFLLQVVLSSCSLQHPNNIIAIDGEGRPVSPKGKCIKGRFDTSAVYTQQIADLKADILSKDKDTILIYIHGGLIGLKGTYGITRSEKIMSQVEANSEEIYPIFINWEAGLFTSYGQHLFKVRQGELPNRLRTIGSAPFFFVWDFTRALVRLPRNLFFQSGSDLRIDKRRKNANQRLNTMLQDPNRRFGLNKPEDLRSGFQKTTSFITYGALIPISYTVSMTAIDWWGMGAWSNMKRKTNIMFRPHTEFEYHRDLAQHSTESHAKGPLYALFTMIEELRNERPDLVINFIGHSMGTIIANEAISTFPNLKIDNLVYMGAACSFRDVEQSVVPALERDTTMRFYNLMLHPKAEAQEVNFLLPPGGSLLEWIDNYFEDISYFQERSFGKYENTMVTAHIFPEALRPRITLKTFDFKRDGSVPYKHDHFTKQKELGWNPKFLFWRPDFWEVK